MNNYSQIIQISHKFPIKFNLFTITTEPKDQQLFSNNTTIHINFQFKFNLFPMMTKSKDEQLFSNNTIFV